MTKLYKEHPDASSVFRLSLWRRTYGTKLEAEGAVNEPISDLLCILAARAGSDLTDEEIAAVDSCYDVLAPSIPAPCELCGERCVSQLEGIGGNSGKPWPVCSGCDPNLEGI